MLNIDNRLTGTASDHSTITRKYGEQVNRAVLGTPSKSGFTFLGWYIDEDTNFDFQLPITKSLNIFAKWEENIVADVTVEHWQVHEDASETLLNSEIIKDLQVGAEYTAKGWQQDDLLPDKAYKKITVVSDASKNKIVFKHRSFTTVDYTINYFKQDSSGQIEVLAPAKTITVQKSIDTQTYLAFAGLVPLNLQETLHLSQDPQDNVMNFYYRDPQDYYYTIRYLFGEGDGILQQSPDYTEQRINTLAGTRVKLENISQRLGDYVYKPERSLSEALMPLTGDLVLDLVYERQVLVPGQLPDNGPSIPDLAAGPLVIEYPPAAVIPELAPGYVRVIFDPTEQGALSYNPVFATGEKVVFDVLTGLS